MNQMFTILSERMVSVVQNAFLCKVGIVSYWLRCIRKIRGSYSQLVLNQSKVGNFHGSFSSLVFVCSVDTQNIRWIFNGARLCFGRKVFVFAGLIPVGDGHLRKNTLDAFLNPAGCFYRFLIDSQS